MRAIPVGIRVSHAGSAAGGQAARRERHASRRLREALMGVTALAAFPLITCAAAAPAFRPGHADAIITSPRAAIPASSWRC